MSPEPENRIPRVREERPSWPRRDREEELPEPTRWQRPPEPWETPFGVEAYPGAMVLEDIQEEMEDPVGTVRVLARYAVIRVLLLNAAGVLMGAKLKQERRIAMEHVGLLPTNDWERMTLQRLTELCRDEPPPFLLGAVSTAAEAAAKRGHAMGAFALFSAAYQLGLDRGQLDDAARAARGISRLARMDEAQYSARLWERRANAIERRVVRLREEARAAAVLEAEEAARAAEEAARAAEETNGTSA
jgi:hypothetical protein